MEYKILREEAFVSVFNLHADFEYKEKNIQSVRPTLMEIQSKI